MKTCQIYGHNGFDLCVTFNLVKFYQKLGYKTFFSKNIYEVDLLVVIRPVDCIFDLNNYHIPSIHVYDYVGNDFDSFIDNIKNKNFYIFTTTEEKRKRIIENTQINSSQVIVALPHVEIDLWLDKKQKKTKKTKLVHIGNYKPVTDEDEHRSNFLEFIKNNTVDVWGLKWNQSYVGGIYRGKCSLFNVSKVYANSNVALGFMYPFQRSVTFSSRFWQTTLNGCYLLSEPGYFVSKIPGVLETNFTKENINEIVNSIDQNYDLSKYAQEYWKSQNEATRIIVKHILSSNTEQNVRKLPIVVYLKLNMLNYVKKSYQKPSIYSILNFLHLT